MAGTLGRKSEFSGDNGDPDDAMDAIWTKWALGQFYQTTNPLETNHLTIKTIQSSMLVSRTRNSRQWEWIWKAQQNSRLSMAVDTLAF
jgi:hypothetical protein